MSSWGSRWGQRLALSCQITFALQVRNIRQLLIRLSSIALLILLGGMFARAGLFVEAIVLVFVGLGQALSLAPGWSSRYQDRDILRVMAVVTNIASGIFLLSIEIIPEHAYTDVLPYRLPLAIVFLVAAALGTFSIFNPTAKWSNFLARLGAVPWLVWSVIFIAGSFSINMIAPLSFAAMILAGDVFPWQRLTMPETDILGRRVVMVMSTAELMILIFLSALLALVDQVTAATHSVTTMRPRSFSISSSPLFCITASQPS